MAPASPQTPSSRDKPAAPPHANPLPASRACPLVVPSRLKPPPASLSQIRLLPASIESSTASKIFRASLPQLSTPSRSVHFSVRPLVPCPDVILQTDQCS